MKALAYTTGMRVDCRVSTLGCRLCASTLASNHQINHDLWSMGKNHLNVSCFHWPPSSRLRVGLRQINYMLSKTCSEKKAPRNENVIVDALCWLNIIEYQHRTCVPPDDGIVTIFVFCTFETHTHTHKAVSHSLDLPRESLSCTMHYGRFGRPLRNRNLHNLN